MGEAKRTRQIAERLLLTPQTLRDEIAAEVAAVDFMQPGGTCLFRNLLAQRIISRRIGVELPLVIGGMIYRCGPDPSRDVVAFCGPDNRALKRPGGVMGHYWLEMAGVIVDFSPPDWRREADVLCSIEAAQIGFDLGAMQFTAEPPAFVWGTHGTGIVLPSARGEPPLGRAYYTAEPVMPAEARDAITDVSIILACIGPQSAPAVNQQEAGR